MKPISLKLLSSFLFWLVSSSLLVNLARSSLIGIDIGNDNSKVASIRPGRGIEIVLNSHSQRKTATAVSFSSSSPSIVRLFGEDALGSMVRNPIRTLLHIPSFLGMCGDEISETKLTEHNGKTSLPNGLRRDLFPYVIEHNNVQNGSVIRIDGHGMIPEELTGHYLDFLRRMVESSSTKDGQNKKGGSSFNLNPGPVFGSETVGAVIAIPPVFTQRQRKSLVDSAEIAGLNLFGLVNSLGAAAVHQSTDLRNNENSTFIYYDMGAKHTSSCVVEFQPVNATHMGRTVQTHKINVLGCSTNFNSGGYLADQAISDLIIERIRTAPEKSPLAGIPLDNSRVLQKIAKQSVRTKLLLSTLKQADFFVESLYKDVDISQSISREEFDRLINENILSKALEPINESLRVANRTMDDITDVEILGGGIRVPSVRALLDRYFGSFGKNVSQRLNGDEAMAFGAAFVAANQSATFRTKNIFYNEYSSNEYSLKIGDRVIPVINSTTHYHGVHRVEVRSGDDFNAILSENGRPVSRFNISGIPGFISEAQSGGSLEDSLLNVTLQIRVDTYGILSLESAYGWKMVNQTIRVPVIVPVNSTKPEEEDSVLNSNSTVNSTESGSVLNGGKKNSTKTVYEEKVITRSQPFMLKFLEEPLDCPLPLTREIKQSISHHINELNKLDAKHRQLMYLKNSLEALIYDNRNKLYDEIYQKVTLEEERENITKLLSDTEDWLYEIGDSITLELVEEKIKNVSNMTDLVHIKAEEFKYRNELITNVDKKLNFTIQTFEAIQFTHTWVQNSTFTEVKGMLDEFQTWYNDTKTRQSELKPTDSPVLLRSETLEKLNNVVSNVQRVRNIPKPRPKIKSKPKKQDNETQSNNSTSNQFNSTISSNNMTSDSEVVPPMNTNSTLGSDSSDSSNNSTKIPSSEQNRDQSEL
ncbi:heat shock protein [Cryptosporidium ubiquitum]|uniref:Heat shock protein n=1 Tax=Cryptosporidium ubiquitum TaxID=857276 RepID=A0A1J4MD67_9CRYT|nr:heat shock protein [Cryptosporidium ubiquitum]OII71927.1 heat shock protein [Cryptosporidium ubiquitum]